jgi:MFS family permease
MSPHESSIETRYGWVIVFASLAVHSIGLGAPTILFVALKPIAADLGTARAVPSLAYSMLMVGAGVGGVAMGWWMDRRGILQPVVFGSLMVGLGAIVASQSESRWSLYVANGLLIGLLGKAAMIAPLVANVTRWFDRRRGLAVAIITAGQGVAGAVWPGIIQSMNDAFGWRGTYLYYGIFALLTMLPITLLLRPRPPVDLGASARSRLQRAARVLDLPQKAVQGMLWLAVVGCCTAMAMPIVHLVSHATDLGHDPRNAALLLSILFTAAFVSRIGFGMLADRIGPMRTLLIGSVCQAVTLLTLAVTTSYWALALASLLFGLGFAGIMPNYALAIRLLFPVEQAGWRIASQYLFAALGMALGGWLAGVIFDLTGSYADAFVIGVAFNLMNLALVATLLVRQTRLSRSLASA